LSILEIEVPGLRFSWLQGVKALAEWFSLKVADGDCIFWMQ